MGRTSEHTVARGRRRRRGGRRAARRLRLGRHLDARRPAVATPGRGRSVAGRCRRPRRPSWTPAVESTGDADADAATPTPTTPTPSTTPSAPRRDARRPRRRPRLPDADRRPTKPRTSLIRGDQGPKVLALQRRLSELGYWLGEPDGAFGSLTQQAVWALQKSAGLEPRRRRRPQDASAPSSRACGRRSRSAVTASRSSSTARSSSSCAAARASTILNTSTGNGEEYTSTSGNRAIATTPRGSFTVYRAVDGPLTNSLGELWRPRFFHRGYRRARLAEHPAVGPTRTGAPGSATPPST